MFWERLCWCNYIMLSLGTKAQQTAKCFILDYGSVQLFNYRCFVNKVQTVMVSAANMLFLKMKNSVSRTLQLMIRNWHWALLAQQSVYVFSLWYVFEEGQTFCLLQCIYKPSYARGELLPYLRHFSRACQPKRLSSLCYSSFPLILFLYIWSMKVN